MADFDDEFYYLDPDFDPNQLTVPKLRSILLKHNVQYPSTAKKSVMVDLFNENIAPQASRLLRSHARTKPSTRGIQDVPSSQASTTDENEDQDQTLVAPPSTIRRTSRRARAGTEEEAPRTVSTRHKTPSSAVPTKHGRASDMDIDEAPAARRTRHSVTPAVKPHSPEPEIRHRDDIDSPFSSENPFQSGSSPPSALKSVAKDRRRTTMGVVDQREKRRSEANRRRTAQAKVEQFDEGIVVPTRPDFQVRSQALPNDADAIEPGEEFTSGEEDELEREKARTGQVDVLPPRKRNQRSKAKGTLKAGGWAVTLTALVAFAGVWRQEKLAVGYCGMGQDVTSLAGVEIPDWASSLLPQCEPCPPHAYCYKNLETSCEPDFVLRPHPLSFNGLVPLPPTCEPDSEKARRINAVTDRSVQILRKRRAEYECGEPDKEGKPVSSPEMGEAELKQQVSSMKRKGMSQAEFEDLWKSAIGAIVTRDEVERNIDEKTGEHRITSTSYAGLTLSCSFKRWLRESLERHLRQLVGVISFVGIVLYSWWSFKTSRAMEARAKQLAGYVFDRLAAQAALNYQEPGGYPDLGISVTQLRDDILRTEFSASKRQKLWARVEKKVENNSNIRAALKEAHSGDYGRVWEWIGPVQMIDDGRSPEGRDKSRRSLGSVVSSPPSSHAKELHSTSWDEARPIY